MPPKRRRDQVESPQPTARSNNVVTISQKREPSRKAALPKPRDKIKGNRFTRNQFETFGAKGREFDNDAVDEAYGTGRLFGSEDSSSEEYPDVFTGEAKVRKSRRLDPKKPVWSDSGIKLTEEELVALVEGETQRECVEAWKEGPKTTKGFQPMDPRFRCKSGISKELEDCQKLLSKGRTLKGTPQAERLVDYAQRNRLKSDCRYNANKKHHKTERVNEVEGFEVKKGVGYVATPKKLELMMAQQRRLRQLYGKRIEPPRSNQPTNRNENDASMVSKVYDDELSGSSGEDEPKNRDDILCDDKNATDGTFGFY